MLSDERGERSARHHTGELKGRTGRKEEGRLGRGREGEGGLLRKDPLFLSTLTSLAP